MVPGAASYKFNNIMILFGIFHHPGRLVQHCYQHFRALDDFTLASPSRRTNIGRLARLTTDRFIKCSISVIFVSRFYFSSVLRLFFRGSTTPDPAIASALAL